MAELKYILSSGRGTTRVEEYIIDLFKLYLKIEPGDIPFVPDYGFNFDLSGIYKADLAREIESRVGGLVSKINSRFSSGVNLSLKSLELVDETKVRIVVSAGEYSSEITLNVY